MKLENQVCSLELSKKLKELGLKQESLFYWQYNLMKREFIIVPKSLTKVEYENIKNTDYPVFSAFNVAELGEMLPNWVNICRLGKISGKNSGKYCCNYNFIGDVDDDKDSIETIADTEANARAKMLIYLLENKLIKL